VAAGVPGDAGPDRLEGLQRQPRRGRADHPDRQVRLRPDDVRHLRRPGVRYPYHRLVENDWWDENPASPTYNTFVHRTTSPGGASEALWRIWPAYRHFAVITYNMPDPVPGKGSAIFLHEGTGGPTAGCVSLGSADLVKILTWLDPARMPRIVMAPVHVLDRY